MATLRIDWDRGKIKEYVLWTWDCHDWKHWLKRGLTKHIVSRKSQSKNIFIIFIYQVLKKSSIIFALQLDDFIN